MVSEKSTFFQDATGDKKCAYLIARHFSTFFSPFYRWFIKATQDFRKICTYTKRANFASLVSEAISCLKEIKNALGKLQKMRVFIDFWPLCKHYKFLRSEEFWNDLELKESWFMCNSCGFGHLSWQRFWGARERGERGEYGKFFSRRNGLFIA